MKIIIPARGGSKRVLNKNIIDLNGKPLITYVVESSLQVAEEVYVSTDSLDIEEAVRKYDVKIIKRPPALATDFSTTNSVIKHFIEHLTKEKKDVEYFACVQPTSPLLTPRFLKEGFKKIQKSSYNSIVSVSECAGFFWDRNHQPINFERDKRQRTQDMESWYVENGAFYMTSATDFMLTNNLINGKVGFIVMPRNLSFEIDTYEDAEIIESIICSKEVKR